MLFYLLKRSDSFAVCICYQGDENSVCIFCFGKQALPHIVWKCLARSEFKHHLTRPRLARFISNPRSIKQFPS